MFKWPKPLVSMRILSVESIGLIYRSIGYGLVTGKICALC